ncbi:MAG: TIGR01777 family oxidoreductase [Thermomicrobiales bacterium]|nr:TIGR01777 family oxidoreductase [Thermomicrobiales bacterium]
MNNQTILIAGGSGLIGSALIDSLRGDGIHVRQLVRRQVRSENEIEWNPGQTPLDPGVLEDVTAIINLSGASIGRLPWTKSYKRTLSASRIGPTKTLATAVKEFGHGAPTFISASAVGYYGNRPGHILTEADNAGQTFLAQLCDEWEREALAAKDATRVTLLRTAPILHPKGVLKPMIMLTRFGLGGPLGKGEQIWPWISLTDEVRAIRHILETDLEGPVNLAGPVAASANQIGSTLAKIMHKPYLLPAPAWALRLGIGRDAADGLLLSDANVVPDKLLGSGFQFEHRTQEEAISAAMVPEG